MIDVKIFINEPVPFGNICKIYCPTVRQVVTVDNFPVYRKILTISQEELEDEYRKNKMELRNVLTPLEYLLNTSYNDKQIEKLSLEAFEFFLHEPVTFLYEKKKVLIGKVDKISDLGDFRFLDETNFFNFQNKVRNVLGEKSIEPPNPNENPRVKEMKAKSRYRERIVAKKNGLILDTILISVCCMGIGITPLNVGELSYATLIQLMNVYQEKEKYGIDIQSLLAGASSEKVKPKYWIHNPEKE